MKDSIQQKSPEVSIVIFDAPLPPRYFRVTKKFIRTLFVVAPVLLILMVGAFFIWGLGARLQNAPTPKLPEVMVQSDSKISDLEAQIAALENSNSELASKLSSQTTTTTAEDPYLMNIKKPYGMQNFLSENRVSLDQFQLGQEDKKITLKFQIISARPETKVTGNVLVFMFTESGLLVYPKEAQNALATGIKFSNGEPFSVSRLRPTNAEFAAKVTGESAKFLIYIFSREGDLLLIKETESFKLGNK